MTHTLSTRPLRARHVTYEHVNTRSQSSPNALLSGTEVLTRDGRLPVDFLSPGDHVVTRDTGFAVLRAVEVRQRHADIITIAPGALGHNRPDCDARLLSTQEVLLRDWRAAALFGASVALVPAARLVDGTFIRRIPDQMVTTIALIFDAPHILYADGLEIAGAQHAMEHMAKR